VCRRYPDQKIAGRPLTQRALSGTDLCGGRPERAVPTATGTTGYAWSDCRRPALHPWLQPVAPPARNSQDLCTTTRRSPAAQRSRCVAGQASGSRRSTPGCYRAVPSARSSCGLGPAAKPSRTIQGLPTCSPSSATEPTHSLDEPYFPVTVHGGLSQFFAAEKVFPTNNAISPQKMRLSPSAGKGTGPCFRLSSFA